MDVQEIDALRDRLDAADCVADTLAAGWDTFELVEVIADDYADRAPDTFAAFLFAAASAAEGRDAVGFAPSMPASPGIPIGFVVSDSRDMCEVVGELAGLVSILGTRLQAAVHRADSPGDRRAFEHAAREAGRICDLLAPARQ
jgi:hypothetical protein